MKKITAIIAAMIFAILPVKAEGYTYKVVFMYGLHGTKTGEAYSIEAKNGEEIELPALPEGEGIYTAKGWHVSGKDQIWVSGSYPVTEDTVFVASYGVSGDMLSYTVRYLDQAGNTLEAPETFHAKKGDKPVVAYKYIEDYLPVETKAFTFTVEYDGRVIDFIYRPVEQNQQEQEEGEIIEEVIVQPAEPVNPNPNPAPVGPDNPVVNPDNPANPDNPVVNPDNPANPDNQGETIDDNETPQGQPEEIIDLDDEDTPLAPPEEIDDDKTPQGNTDNNGTGPAGNAVLVGGIAGGALILLLLLFLFRRRKQNTEN